ncbi:MAG: hypothetical protein ACRDTA_19720 [Pseudonocardiaceae bacterium]
MSPFTVTTVHIDVLLTAGRVGAMSLAENTRSVNYLHEEGCWEPVYLFHPLPGTPDPLAVLKAIAGLEYQSCERAHTLFRAAARLGELVGARSWIRPSPPRPCSPLPRFWTTAPTGSPAARPPATSSTPPSCGHQLGDPVGQRELPPVIATFSPAGTPVSV